MILVFCLFIFNYTEIFFFIEDLSILLALILLCSFTKRAQFPFSRWLPAAISAPTPISAIVHSSTLVTAGVFVILNIIYHFKDTAILEYLCIYSCIRFLLGRLIGAVELDFKKVVAFSTMRQIRIILFLCSSFLVCLSMVHTFFHAMFKTLLFCCSGIFFISLFRDQISTKLSSHKFSGNLKFLFFLRIYRIRGLLFCSSFYTKDAAIECLYQHDYSLIPFLILLGSFATLIYCCKLMFGTSSWASSSKVNNLYRHSVVFMFLFASLTLFSGDIFLNTVPYDCSRYFTLYDSLRLSLILMIAIIINAEKIFTGNFLLLLSLEISFMKFVTFTQFSKIFSLNRRIEATLRDHWLFKPSNVRFKWASPLKFLKLKNLSIQVFISFFLFILLFF